MYHCASFVLRVPQMRSKKFVSVDPKSTLGCSFCLQNNSIPWMGSEMPLDSSTLAFKSHLNAHALPICGPNYLEPHSFL